MAQTSELEQRVKKLEGQMAELQTLLVDTRQGKKDWTRSVGLFAENDPNVESAERLGREWREQLTYEKEVAGS